MGYLSAKDEGTHCDFTWSSGTFSLNVYQNLQQIISFVITDGYFPKTLSIKALFIFSLVSMLGKSGHAQISTPELNSAWPYIRKYYP